MDRNNDSNPGIVERQLDETPMEGRPDSEGIGGMERESIQNGSVEREGMQGGEADRDAMQDGGGTERDSLTGRESEQLGATNTGANDTQMRVSGREGGPGFDRPADISVTRDTLEGSSGSTDRADDVTRSPDQPRGTTTARDW